MSEIAKIAWENADLEVGVYRLVSPLDDHYMHLKAHRNISTPEAQEHMSIHLKLLIRALNEFKPASGLACQRETIKDGVSGV